MIQHKTKHAHVRKKNSKYFVSITKGTRGAFTFLSNKPIDSLQPNTKRNRGRNLNLLHCARPAQQTAVTTI